MAERWASDLANRTSRTMRPNDPPNDATLRGLGRAGVSLVLGRRPRRLCPARHWIVALPRRRLDEFPNDGRGAIPHRRRVRWIGHLRHRDDDGTARATTPRDDPPAPQSRLMPDLRLRPPRQPVAVPG